MRRATPYLSFLNIETKKNLLKRIGFLTFGGEDGNRTRLNGFAGRCITSLLPRQKEWYRSHARRYSATSTKREARLPFGYSGAGEEARTLDLNLGKVALYQLSYSRYVLHIYYANDYLLLRAADLHLPVRKTGAGEEARTLDLNLGKVALYQLSYSRFARTRLSQKPTEFPRHRYITSNLGAGEEARTLDLNLGKVALYQLSYSRLVLRAASFTTGTHYRSSMRLVKEASASN
jgi:hypothetical protein